MVLLLAGLLGLLHQLVNILSLLFEIMNYKKTQLNQEVVKFMFYFFTSLRAQCQNHFIGQVDCMQRNLAR